MYPPYYPQTYKDQGENEEEKDPYSYASMDRQEVPFRRYEQVDLFQHPYQRYNTGENCGNPNLPPRNSEPETSQGSSVFDRLGRRLPRNRRERRATAATNQPSRVSPFPQYQTQRVHSPATISSPQLRSYEIDDEEETSHFSEGIQRCKILHDFEMPETGKYVRRRDPDDHLLNYNASMVIARATPTVKYKAFPLTLEGSALRWYKKLISGSIHSWKDLKTTFRNGFKSPQLDQHLVQCLQDLRQGKHELLKSYLARFIKEMHKCENITEAEIFLTLKGGLEMRSMF
ncbi:Retrotrans gag domain-containing protein [Abeliophyllum distichum]|uniref:Retrotrans gag domain-containing protein n=1 Tax=Abeliophyllum distichum TaxID=126358 RepID=A0ABD1T0C1_9LAMI